MCVCVCVCVCNRKSTLLTSFILCVLSISAGLRSRGLYLFNTCTDVQLRFAVL